MELVWCSNCRADVSLAHAVAEMPCPACGGKEYFVAADDGSADALLFKAERMMRLGRWSEAAAAFGPVLRWALSPPRSLTCLPQIWNGEDNARQRLLIWSPVEESVLMLFAALWPQSSTNTL